MLVLQHYPNTNPDLATTIAGWVSGLASAPFLTLIDHTKIKVQIQREHKQEVKYKGSWDAFKKIYRRHGFFSGGLMHGFCATSLISSTALASYFVTYNVVKRKQMEMGYLGEDFINLISGGASGVLMWVIIFPLDTLKTRVQSQSLEEVERGVPGNWRHQLRSVLSQEGIQDHQG